jgi:hypothetical protein
MPGYSDREFGEMAADIRYLKDCCNEVKKDMDNAKSRNTAILTSVVLLLGGTVVNLIMTYAK